MNRIEKQQIIQVALATVVLRCYAVVIGLTGVMFLYLPGTDAARVFGGGFFAAALCAAALSYALPQARPRSVFWVALGQTAVWLSVVIFADWAWRPVTGFIVATITGTLAWMLFTMWLTATGGYSATTPGLFRSSAAPKSEALRSQYEQKIRQAAAQEERNRLARDLHDSIKQQIFAIQTAAATAQVNFDGESGTAREALNQIRSSAREAMTEMEVMLDQLRAEPLEHVGLVEALKKLCETIGFRTGAQVEFKLGEMPSTGTLPPGAAETTLRAAQEALANVARHARATHASVSLDSAEGLLKLTVQDNGAGFDPQETSRGMGTANMRSRAEELGGKFEISSRPAAGTTVRFSVPCVASEATVDRAAVRPGTFFSSVSFGLFMLSTVVFSRELHRWMLVPCMAFTAVLAVIHYMRLNAQSKDYK
jgi:signal transduction histidine kinase